MFGNSVYTPGMDGHTIYLLGVLFGAIVLLVVLINWRTKMHPFLALYIVAFLTALAAGEPISEIPETLMAGSGKILGNTGILVFLGAMLGKLLADSGAVSNIADFVLDHASPKAAPWVITGVAFILGIPMFFEVGLVVLMPVIYAVALRLEVRAGRPQQWYLRTLIPAIAALCCLHGMVPPHPGPIIGVQALNADMGLTIILGLLCAVPTVILAGPIYGNFIAPRIKLEPPASLVTQYAGTTYEEAERIYKETGSFAELARDHTETPGAFGAPKEAPTQRPGAWSQTTATAKTGLTSPPSRSGISTPMAFCCVLLPVVLMLIQAVVKIVAPKSHFETIAGVVGQPIIAMLVGVLFTGAVIMIQEKWDGDRLRESVTKSLAAVATVVMIVAGGGAFNAALKDSDLGDAIASAAGSIHMNLIVLGWLIGLLLSFCTGSATVGIVSASGILAPLVIGCSAPYVSLIVIAIGSGSIGLNWVNHSGFWFVKECFGMTLGQATKTHMVVQTIVSVLGLIFTFLLSLFFA